MSDPVELFTHQLGAGKPLMILHGLFGSGRNWAGIARQLGARHRVHVLDARNHGASPWVPTMSYLDMAHDLAAYIDALGRGPADIIGHSMGGKTAMTLALTRPELVRQLIVVDIAPVTYRGSAQDPYSAYIAAMQGLNLSLIRRRSEADAALSDVIADAAMRAFLVQNLEPVAGGYRWRINLEAIAANLSELTSFPQLDGQFDGLATVLAGELSDYVRPRDEPAIRHYFPKSRIIVIDGAGHWPHADQPERLLALLRETLEGAQ